MNESKTSTLQKTSFSLASIVRQVHFPEAIESPLDLDFGLINPSRVKTHLSSAGDSYAKKVQPLEIQEMNAKQKYS